MILRTTNSLTHSSMMGSITSAQNKLNQLTVKLSSGKKVNQLTDDAIAAKGILNATKEMNQIKSYISNMSQAQTELDTADTTLSLANTSVQKAYDVAMMAANGTYGKDEIYAFKTEVDSIISNLKDLANAKYSNNYLFSGTRTAIPAYTETEDGMIYNGSPSTGNYERQVMVADGTAETINQTGDALFGYATWVKDPVTDEITGVDGEGIFKALYELKFALDQDEFDTEEVRATLDGFSKGVNTLAEARADIGATSNRFDVLKDSYESYKIQLTSLKSNLEDADVAELISQWTTQQYALESSYAIASQLLQQNIMNYL